MQEAWYKWFMRWKAAITAPIPQLPAPKIFKPKHNLPILESYTGDAPDSYWASFKSNLRMPASSLVKAGVLRRLALEQGFDDLVVLELACKDLEFGADIGCEGRYREPSRATNAPSAYAEGVKVSDAICDWLHLGFAYGPVDDAEVPKDAKFSGIMTRPKPTGAVRIILNLSAPAGDAVNEGIDNSRFPAVMSSTTKWLKALWIAGKRCWISKVDWSFAYKHCAVRPEDLSLQWFRWLGKNFCELCLIFGCVSSAGIFDRLAKIVLFIVRKRAGMPAALICQHLDDCCAAAPSSSTLLHSFDAIYSEVAAELGVKLAPRDDPEKSFGPSTSGIVLGIHYDTVEWTWAYPQDKLIRLLCTMKSMMDAESCTQKEMWSLVGKLLHVHPLIPDGRFNIYHVLKANNLSTDPKFLVEITPGIKRQLFFWITMLQTCSGAVSIPRPNPSMPPWALEVHSDAAGGTTREPGHGVGMVALGFWSYLPWGRAINSGRRTSNGRRLDRVMSALELVGPLFALSAAASICRGLPVKFFVDNAGSNFIWKKGYSTSCPLATTVVMALRCVAAGLGCRIDLVKVTRCSTPLADMADALSKAAFPRFWDIARSNGGFQLSPDPLPVPASVIKWVMDPVVDFDLGEKILKDLAYSGPVLGY